jgi:hypothetical protein
MGRRTARPTPGRFTTPERRGSGAAGAHPRASARGKAAAGAGEERGASAVRPGWRFACSLSLWALVTYLAIVLPIDRLLPRINVWYVGGALILLSLALLHRALGSLLLRRPDADDLAKNVTLFSAMSLICLLALEVAFTVYGNLNPEFRIDQARVLETRVGDTQTWVGELMPTPYFLPERHVWLYKPGQTVQAAVYGEHYYPALLKHPLLRDSVLELRTLDFQIDAYGLRNREGPAGARLFTLGDSFCLGFGAPQSAVFSERMQAALGEPVYNMGVAATSPTQQVELLDHLLTTHPAAFRPEHLLWLVFEGNDLDESVTLASPLPAASKTLGEIFAHTLVGDVARIPAILREQSAIRLLTSGRLALRDFGARDEGENHYELDGSTLAYPLYRSPKFGPRLFRRAYLENATQPASAVLEHPNRERFDAAFERMQTLAASNGFQVTVVSVPTDARLYKDAFDDMPPITQEPHFIRHVEQLAQRAGFEHVDLNALLAPFAENELLYYRDDTHWNERGHQVVADLLTRHLTGTGAAVARQP